jgi:tetratricopeptide (TPR) repeat protein
MKMATGVALVAVLLGADAAEADVAAWEAHSLAGIKAHEERRFESAEREFREALREAEALAPHDWRLIVSLDNLGDSVRALQQTEEAEVFYREAVAVAEALRGGDDLLVLEPLKILAWFYQRQHRYDDAARAYERGMLLTGRVFGSDHPQVTLYLTALAELARLQGRYLEGEGLIRWALSIVQPVRNDLGPGLAAVFLDLAWFLQVTGREAAAEAVTQEAVRTLRRAPREAEALIRKALDVREGALGADHPSVAPLLDHLALVLEVQDRFGEAGAVRQRALRITGDAFGEGHLNLVPSLRGYSGLLRRIGREADARVLEARAAAITARAGRGGVAGHEERREP